MRSITQDDAHIFCTEEQIEDEVIALPRVRILHLRPLRVRARASAVHPPGQADRRPTRCGTGPRTRWRAALEAAGIEYELNPGDGAFYGPKIDLHMTDSIGRSWQLGTVQLDYQMPERFELDYTGADNAEHQPVMIHRALLGSFERFIGILIEHYAGEFPLWLAPVQAVVLPIADRHVHYASRWPPSCAAPGVRVRGGRPHASRWARRSATRSCARSPTCWWWATARRTVARSPSAATGGRPGRDGRFRASPLAPRERNRASHLKIRRYTRRE